MIAKCQRIVRIQVTIEAMKNGGTVVIIGRPNTGKSTLINTIMRQKVAITSPMPQTTQKVATVVYRDSRGWFYLSDTPGIMSSTGADLIKEATVVVGVVDVSRPKNEEDNKALGIIRKTMAKKILVFNKSDKAIGSKDHRHEYLFWEDEFDKRIEVSSLKDKNVLGLVEMIFSLLPENSTELPNEVTGPQIPMSSEEFVAEIIREKVYLCLRREIPYSTSVEVVEIKDKTKLIYVRAYILTNVDKYKKMIIGAGGRKIKQIGHDARKELEIMSGRKIYLDLEVKTRK